MAVIRSAAAAMILAGFLTACATAPAEISEEPSPAVPAERTKFAETDVDEVPPVDIPPETGGERQDVGDSGLPSGESGITGQVPAEADSEVDPEADPDAVPNVNLPEPVPETASDKGKKPRSIPGLSPGSDLPLPRESGVSPVPALSPPADSPESSGDGPEEAALNIPDGTSGPENRTVSDDSAGGGESEPPPVNPLLVEDVPYREPAARKADPAPQPVPSESSAPPASTIPVPSGPIPEIRDPRAGPETPTVRQEPAAEPEGTEPLKSGNNGAAVGLELITPGEQAAAPSRWMESPGEFTVLLEGQGWVFRSDLSTPGSWRFLGRELDGQSTRFTFLFDEPGDWNLVFERQDLSSGGSERALRVVRVGGDGNPVVENGPLSRRDGASIPGDMPDSPAERTAAAREAADAGRSAEALGYWSKDADRDDRIGRDARAAIVEEAARTGSVGPLVTWLPEYIEDGADPAVLMAALRVLENQMGYDDSTALVVEELAGNTADPRRPEWLYRLARILEKPGESRDLDRSAALYRQVIEDWPLTEWRDLSEERLAWLERHYFRVR